MKVWANMCPSGWASERTSAQVLHVQVSAQNVYGSFGPCVHRFIFTCSFLRSTLGPKNLWLHVRPLASHFRVGLGVLLRAHLCVHLHTHLRTHWRTAHFPLAHDGWHFLKNPVYEVSNPATVKYKQHLQYIDISCTFCKLYIIVSALSNVKSFFYLFGFVCFCFSFVQCCVPGICGM